MERLSGYAPQAQALLRIVAGLAFLQHGLMKIFQFPATAMDGPLPPIMLAAGWLEIVGAALLILGLFTRPTAFVLSGFMAVAYFMAHAPKSFFPILNGGDSAIQFSFVFLYLVFAGPGAWSLDENSGA